MLEFIEWLNPASSNLLIAVLFFQIYLLQADKHTKTNLIFAISFLLLAAAQILAKFIL
jgi:hypothetical protein